MMLAPKTSIQEHLPNILKFLQQKLDPITTQKSHKFRKLFNKKTPERTIDHDQLVDDNQAVEFLENVLINASTVASHDAYDLMEPTNSLKENYPTKIKIAQFALDSLTENLSYEEELNKNGLQLDKMVNLKHLNEHLLTFNRDEFHSNNKALFELAANAKWCLLAVEEAEKRKERNMDSIKKFMRNYTSNITKPSKKSVEDLLKEMKDYKVKHGVGNKDYYESFKLQNEHADFEANVNRLEQAKIWDVVIEMVMRKDLPDEFEVSSEVVDLATRFRRFYEPLDIGNYYRHSKGDDTGKYMAVRPKRYKFTQRWYEHANVTGFESVCESNFVAEVEELIKEVIKPKNKTIEEVKKDYESIENKVKEWKSDEKISYEDVFWGESILSKLQEELTRK
ncbi:hypothetical protein L1987_08338 [Smallanthus sonchifolius]|uniref:Uncharacterized protein n=1 Tax=Smallanthus sonchifolius TaxID=185202 RepID=A0ACB9JMM6_9ASTR|nr:hypothetical protein L1987_08338 [Smallanthus sonchifolius]